MVGFCEHILFVPIYVSPMGTDKKKVNFGYLCLYLYDACLWNIFTQIPQTNERHRRFCCFFCLLLSIYQFVKFLSFFVCVWIVVLTLQFVSLFIIFFLCCVLFFFVIAFFWLFFLFLCFVSLCFLMTLQSLWYIRWNGFFCFCFFFLFLLCRLLVYCDSTRENKSKTKDKNVFCMVCSICHLFVCLFFLNFVTSITINCNIVTKQNIFE